MLHFFVSLGSRYCCGGFLTSLVRIIFLSVNGSTKYFGGMAECSCPNTSNPIDIVVETIQSRIRWSRETVNVQPQIMPNKKFKTALRNWQP